MKMLKNMTDADIKILAIELERFQEKNYFDDDENMFEKFSEIYAKKIGSKGIKKETIIRATEIILYREIFRRWLLAMKE